MDVFLNSNVDSLGAIVSMQPADLLEFRHCYGSKAAMDWFAGRHGNITISVIPNRLNYFAVFIVRA